MNTIKQQGQRNARVTTKREPNMPGHVDYIIFFVVMLLVLFGVVMVFSASYYYAMNHAEINDMYNFVKKQFLWSVVGMVGMIFFMNLNYHILKRFAFLSYVFTNITLVLVLFIGREINGSKRWLGIGSFGFQPSEIAKTVIALYLAFYITSHKNILNTFRGFFRCLIIIGIPFALIGLQNLSTALVVGGIGAMVLFVASPKIWYFFPFAGLAGAAGAVMVLVPKFAYRLKRVKAWLDPFSDPTDTGYQIIQSLFAVASGGLFGLGLGQSRQKTFIPEAYNDIIFAIICEELGLVGAALVILLFTILIWRGIKTAMNAPEIFGTLLATGLTSMIAIQVIVNIAVVTNTIPNTGMLWPFISYGGTSMVFTMSAMGILMNISRFQKDNG